MTTHNDQQLMTPKQVARLLNISQRTLYTWHKHGRAPRACKIGPAGNGSVRYRPADVARFIDERTKPESA